MQMRRSRSAMLAAAAVPALAFALSASAQQGWPTVRTPLPRIGIQYAWDSPFCPGLNLGYDAIWQGYPSHTTYYGPGAPIAWVDCPCYWPGFYGQPPLVEVSRRVDPALLPQQPERPAPPEPPTLEQLAQRALRDGAYADAAAMYARLVLEAGASNIDADQGLGVERALLDLWTLALCGDRKFEEAALLLARREQQSPVAAPPMGAALLGSPLEMHNLVSSAVAWAHRARTPQAWRLVAFLMELDGRPDNAAAMRQRAADLEHSATGVAPASTPPVDAPADPADNPDSRGPARYFMPRPSSPRE